MEDLINRFMRQCGGQTYRGRRPIPKREPGNTRGPERLNTALLPAVKMSRQELDRLQAVKDQLGVSWRQLFILMLNYFESRDIRYQKGD